MILHKPSDLPYSPKRIISLVPSQTELLYSLGLQNETIGITKFCIHPSAWYKTKERVGGTKTLQLNKIRGLKPDLIIGNKEENVKEQIEELAQEFPVWLTAINNLYDARQMILEIGNLTHKEKAAINLAGSIQKGFEYLVPVSPPVNTAYLIWQKPYMTIGSDTFIHDMLSHCGFKNIVADKKRYPEITIGDLRDANCQLLLLSSEPYPFKEKHIQEIKNQLPGTKILLADGEMFSWYGSRLLQAIPYFRELIATVQHL